MISQAQFPRQGLYAITPENILKDENSFEKIKAVILGGAKVIQLRLKDQNKTEPFMEKIIQIRKLCEYFSVAFIVNDNVELAIKVEADGVHLGQNDISYPAARRILGNDKIIGISCYNNLSRAIDAAAKGASYIALGSFYDSVTKKKAPRCSIDVLQQTSSPARMDNTISTQKTAEVKQDLPVEKTRDTQLTKVLNSVVSGQDKMSKIIKLATSGRSFNPTELLAIQAGVYKFSQELELTSKVVEKATDGVKQTLQTQV